MNNPGDRVLISNSHPHSGSVGTLIEYGPYGLSFLNLTGWKIKGDGGVEFYADDEDFERVG